MKEVEVMEVVLALVPLYLGTMRLSQKVPEILVCRN